MNFQLLENFMNSLSTSFHIPGASIRVWHRHKEVFSHTVGVRDIFTGEPMVGNEIVDVYSATKPVTAVACMQLIEKGILGINDPAYRYFPSLKTTYIKDANGELTPAKNTITIGHLLSMTSGFSYDIKNPKVQELIEQSGGKAGTVEIMEAMVSTPLLHEPGEHWNYNIGLDVIAAIVEKVSGMPFDQYVKENIFLPLGMNNSYFYDSEAPADRKVYCYDLKPEGLVRREKHSFRLTESFISGGASLSTCADDYIRFTDALANGGVGVTGARILQPSTIDLMRLNRLTPAQRKEIPWAQCKGYGYGLGVRTMVDPAEAGALCPVGEFGWDGLKGAYLIIDPEHELSLFYIEQTGLNKEYLHPRLRNLLYTCFFWKD